ncbi:MAG: hypothetical protein MUE61_17555 [Vicinamibacterales bacterium]|nr:hypothetical protein [Vicinamibacterales bacterium]
MFAAALSSVALAQPAQQAPAQTHQSGEARGVNPADNITKVEVLPKLTVTDDAGGISVVTTTLKFDRAIQGKFGINLEVPLSRFESPFGSSNGLSDMNLRGRAQFRFGRWTSIVGVEGVLPTATSDMLGTGKWQLNPTVALVYPLSKQVFVAVVGKQLLSVAGDSNRDDIRQGYYRALTAYSSPKGWWILADPQLYVDYARAGRTDMSIEGEVGKMVGPMTGAWVRAGGHVAGPWTRNQWSFSGGIRFITL